MATRSFSTTRPRAEHDGEKDNAVVTALQLALRPLAAVTSRVGGLKPAAYNRSPGEALRRRLSRVTDDEIRELLAGVSGDPTGQPDDHVAIFEHTIREFGPDGVDIDAILEWVERHGGYQRMQPKAERIHSGSQREMERFFSVPQSALSGEASE